VPVTVSFDGGEVTKRLEVRGKNKGVIRMEVPAAPREVVVNDGSVPESDFGNNCSQDSGRRFEVIFNYRSWISASCRGAIRV